MKIQEINAILIVAETGSISSAAQKLYTSQPALSQLIKKVEEELGVSLFIRQTGKKMVLTEGGQLYIHMARQLLPIYNSFLKELNAQQNNLQKPLRIGIPQGQGSKILQTFLSYSQHFQFIFQFIEGHSNELEHKLLNGEIDLAIIRLPLTNHNLQYRLVVTEHLGIWLRKGSPWEKEKIYHPGFTYPFLPLKALEGEPLILPPSTMRMRSAIDQFLEKEQLNHTVTGNYQNKKSILVMVSNGLGSTIGMKPAPNEPDDYFYWIEDCPITYNLTVVYTKQSPYKKFISIIADAFANDPKWNTAQ